MKLRLNFCCLYVLLALLAAMASASASWTQCGWGGGGFYWSAAFDPVKNGVIYMGGDVAGVYKSDDHGRNWRLINNGLVDYGVYSLAVDRQNSQTVFAATEGGLCKSTDGGEHWQLLPRTGRKELRLTGERNRSIRAIAVDPTDGNVVYAASPSGKVFKSTDGGQTWKVAYEKPSVPENANVLRVQFGKVNGDYYGGIWSPLTFPLGVKSVDCTGFGFTFKGNGTVPQNAFLTLTTASGATYRSRDIRELFKDDQWRDVVLAAKDFILDPDYAKKHPDKAKELPATPDWSTVNRLDFTCVGPLMNDAPVGSFRKFFFAATDRQQPVLINKSPNSYGNIRLGDPAAGTIYSVTVAQKEPSLVLAATADTGLVLSRDSGQTWRALKTPQQASSAAVAPSDPNIIYGTFFKDGVWKSTDKGQTWTNISQGIAKDLSAVEVAVSPVNPLDVYVICSAGWNGSFYFSNDGGQTWKKSSQLTIDHEGDPTFGQGGEGATTGLSTPTNLAINPQNPQELFISANWRSCLSEDGGHTWTERNRGADISVVTDIRFQNGRTYVTAMDEGALVSENDGKNWRQLWPRKYDPALAGHCWRVAVTNTQGVDRIISTFSPWWDKYCPRVVLSEDGGKTYKAVTNGLPDYVVRPNTMWGAGHPRALAVDPQNPQVVYLGIDGDPSDGKSGGGIFKSEDGGFTWKQLPTQPGSRRMFYGLAVDPTDSQRLYWGACGTGGGLYRSEDSGATWKRVFGNESWIFNLLVTSEGIVYCPGKQLWRSADHGKTWQQLTKFTADRQLVGLEVDPRDPQTLWISATTWDSSSNGAVYKTTDGGKTWQEITGNLPFTKPSILRFNPATGELWAGGAGLFKLKQ